MVPVHKRSFGGEDEDQIRHGLDYASRPALGFPQRPSAGSHFLFKPPIVSGELLLVVEHLLIVTMEKPGGGNGWDPLDEQRQSGSDQHAGLSPSEVRARH